MARKSVLPRPMLLRARAPVVSLETSPAATTTPIRMSDTSTLRVAPHNPGRDERGRGSQAKLQIFALAFNDEFAGSVTREDFDLPEVE